MKEDDLIDSANKSLKDWFYFYNKNKKRKQKVMDTCYPSELKDMLEVGVNFCGECATEQKFDVQYLWCDVKMPRFSLGDGVCAMCGSEIPAEEGENQTKEESSWTGIKPLSIVLKEASINRKLKNKEKKMKLEVGKSYKIECSSEKVLIIGKVENSFVDEFQYKDTCVYDFIGMHERTGLIGLYDSHGIGWHKNCSSVQIDVASSLDISMMLDLEEIKEASVEMTLEEICRALGKNVKIVKGGGDED